MSRGQPCYLGIDVGTQGTKVIAYAPDTGAVIARSSRSYDVIPTTVMGRAEQDPNTWMTAIKECFQDIGSQLSLLQNKNNNNNADDEEYSPIYKISGLGVSGQQHGMVCLDEHLQVLRPAKLWCDVEAAQEAKDIISWARDDLQCDSSYLTPGFTSPKILWMKRNEPEIFAKTRWFVLPHDYVTMQLAKLQRPITDAGDASGNGVFDNVAQQHSKDLANLIDETLLERLPFIAETPNAIVGYLNDEFVQALGLVSSSSKDSSASKIPVSVGSGDNMCAALGVGCVAPGQAVLSLGTSGTLFGVSDTPIPTNTPLAPFCDATGRHLPLACTMSCTGVLTQVLKEWCAPWSHEEASREAAKVPIGCHGITFLPYLAGERTPNIPHATGALLGLTPGNMQYAHDPAVLYRACMEGITMVLANAVKLFPNKIDTLLVVGGGAKNSFWQQMIADCLNCRLMFPLETESAALGAALQAAAAATNTDMQEYILHHTAIPMQDNVVEPKNVKEYEQVLAQFNRFGEALYPS